MSTETNPILLTPQEAADYLNVSLRMVRRIIETKRISYIKIGKHIRFDKNEIDAYLSAHTIRAL
jgi:excisionase family DNA binding protein